MQVCNRWVRTAWGCLGVGHLHVLQVPVGKQAAVVMPNLESFHQAHVATLHHKPVLTVPLKVVAARAELQQRGLHGLPRLWVRALDAAEDAGVCARSLDVAREDLDRVAAGAGPEQSVPDALTQQSMPVSQ